MADFQNIISTPNYDTPMALYIGNNGVAQTVKKAYIGINTEFYICTDEGQSINTIIDNTNISDYFTITNGTYGFIWNDIDNAFSSTNGGVNSSTATSTWTALQDIKNISFTYSYSSESNYDKFTLTVAGNTIVNNVSGSTTIKTWSGDILTGESIVLKYTKDSSANSNDDKCKIYNISFKKVVIPPTYISQIKPVAKKVKKIYMGINNVARQIYPCGKYKTMTVVIDQSNSNPESCITYADDAVGMTPSSSEWDDFFGHYPCLFKDGVEVGRLNPNNFAQFEDGADADITSGNAGDVMIAFPKLGYKISTSGDIVTVSMTDNPNAEGYCYLAHTRGATVKDVFYLGAYKGYVTSSKLRSLSGKKPTVNTTIGNFRTRAQANGSGYDQSAFNQLIFRQCMYLLKYKNLNSQIAVGYGYVNGNSASISTGGTNAKGMDYGETTGKLQMKLFGLEDFWGNVYEFIDGIYSDSSRNILTATENFNDTGSGYTNQGASGFSSDTTGYISKVQGTSEKGFVLKEKNGSSSTYYSDYARVYASRIASFGGHWSYGADVGAFHLVVNRSTSESYSNFSTRLMYL